MNLPPEQRLPDGARQRIRQRLLTDEPRRSWLVPVAAAAAVAAVVALGAFLLGRDGAPTAAPAGEVSTTPAPTQVTPTVAPSQPTDEPCLEPLGADIDSHREYVRCLTENPPPPVPCAEEVRLAGATLVTTIGTTELWKGSSKWVVCDSFAAEDGGVPTLLTAYPNDTVPAPSRQSLAVSTNFSREGVAQFFAAGRVMPGVDAISYAFPDGHIEQAQVKDGLWVMEYRPTTGRLATGDLRNLDPIVVTVGDQRFTLQWGTDTCAQTNHGC